MKPFPRSALILTLVVIACAATASIVTLLWDGSFPALSLPNTVLAEARGWSVVTLFIAVPLCIVSMCTSSLRGRLAWLGTLAYFTYTFLEFAVSPPFTALYLLYVVAFGCAIPALVIGAASIEVQRLRPALSRTIASFSILLAVFLSGAWLKGILQQTLAGDFGWPTGAAAVGHVVHALDLGLQVPLAVATAVALFRRRPVGVLLAAVLLINASCMSAALTAMVICSSTVLETSRWQAAPFALVCASTVTLTAMFFGRGLAASARQ